MSRLFVNPNELDPADTKLELPPFSVKAVPFKASVILLLSAQLK